ncbi:MAG: YciI family protein [Polyangiales bacterium]
MQYVCLVYFDPKVVFGPSPEAEAMHARIGPHTAALKAAGHMVSAQPLALPAEAVTVRVRDGEAATTDGPFMETKEVLGGIVVIEARDLNEAVRIAGGFPHASLGAVEVRPLVDFSKPRPRL